MLGTNIRKKVAFISSYLPRKCGIATFTSDLIKNVERAGNGEFESMVIAMESRNDLFYNKPVRFKLRKDVKYDYLYAADHLNFSDIDVVSVQHEFGLFGGDGGSYLNLLLEKLNKPVITTLHTVLEKPSIAYFDSLTGLCEASEKIVVMNKRGIEMLQDIYGVPQRKIKLIPHGIPDLSFVESDHYKRKLGMDGRRTILTFGLLSRNKGIEVMLRALPTIVKANPSVLYIVLGAMHPEVARLEGQSYKLKLENMVQELGLQRNVVFHSHFVSDAELFQFLGAADIYITPYLNKEQLTSGTLAFAVGTGKAVVSTAYWAAKELLAQGRGKLVRFGDSEHIAQSIVEILSNDSLFLNMRKRAYEYGRSRTWPKVGQAYWKLFQREELSTSILLRPKFDSPAQRIAAYNRQMGPILVREHKTVSRHMYQSA